MASDLRGPSVQWKPEVKQTDDVWQLVLTGQIGDTYYIHPMSDPYRGFTRQFLFHAASSSYTERSEESSQRDVWYLGRNHYLYGEKP